MPAIGSTLWGGECGSSALARGGVTPGQAATMADDDDPLEDCEADDGEVAAIIATPTESRPVQPEREGFAVDLL
jgi:hypothetical protein